MMTTGKDATSVEQLWKEGAIRAFISHKAEDKKLAKAIKCYLDSYGIASFVAHEDIEPLKEWQLEIERALFSMDMMVALLTEKFSESNWTDQEIGVAYGRKVPIIPVRLGKDPYGFMGKYQAISGSDKSPDQIVGEIFKSLLGDNGIGDRLKDLTKDAYILAVARANSYELANDLAGFLPEIDKLSPEQATSLRAAFNENSQVYEAFDFKRSLQGLIPLCRRRK